MLEAQNRRLGDQDQRLEAQEELIRQMLSLLTEQQQAVLARGGVWGA